jgi:hypothetical protein
MFWIRLFAYDMEGSTYPKLPMPNSSGTEAYCYWFYPNYIFYWELLVKVSCADETPEAEDI